MDCGTSLVKYILFLFNTLVSILGCLAVIYGILLLNSMGMIEVNGQVGFPAQAAMPITLIVIGSIVVFISFLGCCGAIRESVCMTMTYAIFLLLLLLVQLTLVVLLLTNKDKFDYAMGEVIDQAWSKELREAGVFDTIQKSLKCCGKDGIQDYIENIKSPPASCCDNGNCVNPLNIRGGCRKKFIELVSGSTENAKLFGIGLMVVELVGFIFACCLSNNIRNFKRRNAY